MKLKIIYLCSMISLLCGNSAFGMDYNENELYENPWNDIEIEDDKKSETQTDKQKLVSLQENLSYEKPISSLDQRQNEIKYYALYEQLIMYKKLSEKLKMQLKQEIEKNKLYKAREQEQQAKIEKLLKILKNHNNTELKPYITKETQEDIEKTTPYPKQEESLFEAVISNNLSNVEYAIKNGADVNKQYEDGSTPLLWAVSQGNPDIVIHLIEQGAKINKGTIDGITPLYVAVRNGYEAIVKYLIEHGANINTGINSKTTPLYIAARNGYENIVKYLVENGADINKGNNEGITPLFIAKHKNHKNIVEYLEKHNSDIINKANENEITSLPTAKSKKEDITLLDLQKQLITAITKNNLSTVKNAVTNGANLNIKDSFGFTPLHIAVQLKNLEIVKYLVDQKANVNSKDNSGNTSLHTAIRSGSLEIVKYLVDQKANINSKDNSGNTPLHTAIWSKNLEIIKYLTEIKSRINAQDENGNTPLHIAASIGNFELVKYLTKMKADVNVTNKLGKTALIIATEQQKKLPSLKQYQQIISYLTNISKKKK